MRCNIFLVFLCVSVLISFPCFRSIGKPNENNSQVGMSLQLDKLSKNLIESQWKKIKTLSTSYVIERTKDNGKTWQEVVRCILFWDIENQKYYYSFLPIGKEKGENKFVEVREYYLEDGKWTLVLASQSLGKLAEKKIIGASVGEEMEQPFNDHICYWFDDKTPLDLLNSKWDVSYETAGVIRLITKKPPNAKRYSQKVFDFQKKTGLFLRKSEHILDEKGEKIKLLEEVSIPEGAYLNKNGIFFPKQIIIEAFDYVTDGTAKARVTFSGDLEINKVIPPERFKPKLPIGTGVSDSFAKKSYVVTEKSESAQEALIVKKLDELFEKANE